jgi:serine/threonine protein kinase
MIERIGKYHIDSILGRGTMGIVYKATDEVTQRTVAIKAIHPHLLANKAGAELGRRLKADANAATRRHHENIVDIYEAGQELDLLYIVMEYVKGYELDRLVKSLTPLPLECITDFFLGICEGLAYAHQQGIVHRNLKSTNIIISEDDTIKITNFGIANLENTDQTSSYMAPEQYAGLAGDCRADIYALGIITFELMTLCEDFPPILCQYSVTCTPAAKQTNKIDPTIKLPQSLTKFIDTCINPDANRRYNNMTEVIEAYQAAINVINSNTKPRTANTARNSAAQPVPTAASSFDFELDVDFLETIRLKTGMVNDAPVVATVKAAPAPEPEITQEDEESSTTVELIRALKNIHPVLNHDWMESVPRLLKQLDDGTRRLCYKNILAPKGISLTSAGKFIFTSQRNLTNAKKTITSRPLNTLTDELLRVVNAIGKTRNILLISDALEAGFKQISDIDSKDNLAQQKEKILLSESFLYDFAAALRQHDFDVPENRRGLTADIIKTYIIEVYIKQKILNYGFSPLPLRALKKDRNPFVKTELFEAAKTHRLSIIDTERYYFFMAENPKANLDPYSVRRFLTEDTSMGGRAAYFNVIAVDRTELTSTHYQEKIHVDISNMATPQRQINSEIIQLVDRLEHTQVSHLLPLLMKPLEAEGAGLQTVIEDRLRDYERNLCLMVLTKITRSLKEKAKSADDYEFLFVSLKSFLIESLGDIHDFYYQSPARWSSKSQELEFKVIAYIRLLEKRKNSVFNSDSEAVLAMGDQVNYRKPMDELIQTVNKTIPIIQNLKSTLLEAKRQDAERTPAQKSWDTFLSRKRLEPKEVQQALDQALKEGYLALVNIPKRYPTTTLYLEFEGLISVDESVRHYALPRGEEGLSLLPMLIRLPEDTREFDIFAVKELFKPTLFRPLGDRLLDADDNPADQ